MPASELSLPLTVMPDSGRIGSMVIIRGAQFNPSYSYSVQFPGADEQLLAQDVTDSMISTFIPFGARTGRLTVMASQPIGLTGELRVTESPDTNRLTVQRYDISPPVTPNDSVVLDRMGYLHSWQARSVGDTIHISLAYSTGEAAYERHIVLLNQGTTQLPSILALWIVTKPDYPGTRTDSIHAGILKLQEYSPSGSIAGKFFGKPSAYGILNGTFTFWANVQR